MDESSAKRVNDRLRQERIRRNWRQHDLAEQLGTTVVTVQRWERGSQQPSAYFRVKLCALFGKSAEDLGLVPESPQPQVIGGKDAGPAVETVASPLLPDSPCVWGVPYPRNPFFTGREQILEALHRQLGVDQALALTQSSALQGLGGVGKTQIALEYAYRHALEYRAVFWLGAETIEDTVRSLLWIAKLLQLPEREDKDQQQVIAAVRHWFTMHSQWLLIWDNVEDLEVLDRFLPPARQGAILLTTRRRTLGTFARSIDLLPMEQEEGMLFLLRRAKVLQLEATSQQMRQLAVQVPSQYAAAADLVTITGGLPLALDQTGAYIEETQCGLPAYLELFRSRRAVLLQQRGEASRDHRESVSTTFTLALMATTRSYPAVRDLLQVCALLQADAIPEEVFRQGAEHLGATLEAVCRDVLDWNQVIAIACSYSLLSRQAEEQTLSMHRLVQAVLLDAMTRQEREHWLQRVVDALNEVFPEVLPTTAYATWKQCERLLSHALLCLQQTAASVQESLPFSSLAYKTAQYLSERGRYGEAEPLFLHALSIRQQILGSDHPDVASTLIYLANLYYWQGKYAQAEEHFQRALRIMEPIREADHPDIARALNNLAILYWNQGKYAEAEPLLWRTLHIVEKSLGPDHPRVGATLNNLAILYWNQGKYAEAEPLFERALSIREQALGPEHPDVANTLSNLAILYRDQGRYAEAEPLFQRALQLLEQVVGPDHPLVSYPLNNLAVLYWSQDKYSHAEPLFERALSIREQHLGPRHSETAQTLHDFAALRLSQKRSVAAASMYQRALSIREQVFGEHHSQTNDTRQRLSALLLTMDGADNGWKRQEESSEIHL